MFIIRNPLMKEQPFLFEDMTSPPAPEESEKKITRKKESKTKPEGEERFNILKNTGFILVLEAEAPIRFKREYLFGRPIHWRNEVGDGNYMESPAYERLSAQMDEKARAVFWDESSVAARKRVKKNQGRMKFLEGKLSQN